MMAYDGQSMVKPTLWSVHTVGQLPTYVKGRAVLLGDAVCISFILEDSCIWIGCVGTRNDAAPRLWRRPGD